MQSDDAPFSGDRKKSDRRKSGRRKSKRLPESSPSTLSDKPLPRLARDTIIMHPAEIFENLGITNIPMPEFNDLAQMIYDNFGITVGENKRTLVTGRIHPMLEKYGFRDHRALIDAFRSDGSGELLSELANRISTNHTAFYREEAHFKMLREKILPEITARKAAAHDFDLRVWCAASATGEEAYTILFTLMNFFGQEYSRWRAGVLATDISAEALATGKRGVYNRQRVEPVPKDLLLRYFDRIGEDAYEVKPEIRSEVTFRRLNLNSETYPFRHKFDIIFCRNVMIYFSRSIRLRLLEKMRDWLVPGGVLFVGHSESLVGMHHGFDYLGPALYGRPLK